MRDFENAYWYLHELKDFAERIGIPAARKLRKDELEKAIVAVQRFDRIPYRCDIDFVADFLEADTRATRAEAITAWTELKELDVPKDYVSWVKAQAKRKRRR